MDFEDRIYDWYIDERREFEDAYYASLVASGGNWYWTTKDGQRIHVQELETRHLINIANMLIRNAKAEASLPDYKRFLIDMEHYNPVDTVLQERGITSLTGWFYNENGLFNRR